METDEQRFSEMVHRHRDLVELLEALPQPDRSFVTLHAQGFGYKEIAEATGLTWRR